MLTLAIYFIDTHTTDKCFLLPFQFKHYDLVTHIIHDDQTIMMINVSSTAQYLVGQIELIFFELQKVNFSQFIGFEQCSTVETFVVCLGSKNDSALGTDIYCEKNENLFILRSLEFSEKIMLFLSKNLFCYTLANLASFNNIWAIVCLCLEKFFTTFRQSFCRFGQA